MASGLKSLFTRSNGKGKRNQSESPLFHYMLIFAMCAILLLGGLTKIYLQSKITRLGLQLEKKNLELEIVQQERQNLLVEKARLKNGKFILPRAQQMGLRAPMPGQVRKMNEPSKQLAKKME